MRDAFSTFAPIVGLMVFPVCIPMVGVLIGWIGDHLGPPRGIDLAARRAEGEAKR